MFLFLKLMLKLKLIKSGIAYQKFTRRLMRKEKKNIARGLRSHHLPISELSIPTEKTRI